jgi:hypothetical protein
MPIDGLRRSDGTSVILIAGVAKKVEVGQPIQA